MPAAQSLHADAPTPGPNFPAGQYTHLVLPATEYCPGPQSSHVKFDSIISWPAPSNVLAILEVLLLFLAVKILPAAQLLHMELPSAANRLSGQATHDALDTAPTTVENVPGKHDEHAVELAFAANLPAGHAVQVVAPAACRVSVTDPAGHTRHADVDTAL